MTARSKKYKMKPLAALSSWAYLTADDAFGQLPVYWTVIQGVSLPIPPFQRREKWIGIYQHGGQGDGLDGPP